VFYPGRKCDAMVEIVSLGHFMVLCVKAWPSCPRGLGDVVGERSKLVDLLIPV
jgi:hypothetical protein